MSNQQTVLTALGCAGSLAAVLAMSSPAIASPIAANSATVADDAFDNALPMLVQEDSNPITDALTCSCTVCTGGVQGPTL